jgi:hypothetical protein
MINPAIKTQAQPAIITNKTSSSPFMPVISNPKTEGVDSKTAFTSPMITHPAFGFALIILIWGISHEG